jgi:hypothetical protein
MKLDKPTVTALAIFAAGTLSVVAAELAGKLTFPAAVAAEQPVVMALLVALGIISHGTPAEPASTPAEEKLPPPPALPKDGVQ